MNHRDETAGSPVSFLPNGADAHPEVTAKAAPSSGGRHLGRVAIDRYRVVTGGLLLRRGRMEDIGGNRRAFKTNLLLDRRKPVGNALVAVDAGLAGGQAALVGLVGATTLH